MKIELRRYWAVLLVLAVAMAPLPAVARVDTPPGIAPDGSGATPEAMATLFARAGNKYPLSGGGAISAPSAIDSYSFNYMSEVVPNDGYHDNDKARQNKSLAVAATMICTITNTSVTVTGCNTTAGTANGNVVSGTGIPVGNGIATGNTKIASGITPGPNGGFTMSRPATQSGSVTITALSQGGNNADNFYDGTYGLTRAAAGYSVAFSGVSGFFPNTYYIAIGDFVHTLDPTDFVIVNDHSNDNTVFPGLQRQLLRIESQTNKSKWYGSDANIHMVFDPEASPWPGLLIGLNQTTVKNTVDVYGTLAVGRAYAGSVTAPDDGAIIAGPLAVGASSLPGGMKAEIVGPVHIDRTGGNTATGGLLSVETTTSTDSILYTLAGAGGTRISYNNTDGGVLITDGSKVTLKTGSTNPTAGTAVATLTATQAVFPGGIKNGVTTVSGLPSCTSGLQGTRYFVTDGAAFSYGGSPGAGSGSVGGPVFCDGSGWKQG